MIHNAWTVLCGKSRIDQETNNVSLDVIEQINIEVDPLPDDVPGILLPTRIEAVSLWYDDTASVGTRGRARLRIVSPKGEALGEAQVEVDLASNKRVRTFCRVEALPIPKEQSGVFEFLVELLDDNGAWREVSRVPLDVAIECKGGQ